MKEKRDALHIMIKLFILAFLRLLTECFSAVSYFPSQTSLWHQKQGHQSSDRISVKAVADKPRNCLLFTPMCYKPVSCFYRELSF